MGDEPFSDSGFLSDGLKSNRNNHQISSTIIQNEKNGLSPCFGSPQEDSQGDYSLSNAFDSITDMTTGNGQTGSKEDELASSCMHAYQMSDGSKRRRQDQCESSTADTTTYTKTRIEKRSYRGLRGMLRRLIISAHAVIYLYRTEIFKGIVSLPLAILAAFLLGFFITVRVVIRLSSVVFIRREVRQGISILNTSQTLEEYKVSAKKLDELVGTEDWKKQKTHHWKMVEQWVIKLKTSREEYNLKTLTELIGAIQCLHFARIFSEELYCHTFWGTSYIVDEFIKELIRAFDFIGEAYLAAVYDEQKLIYKFKFLIEEKEEVQTDNENISPQHFISPNQDSNNSSRRNLSGPFSPSDQDDLKYFHATDSSNGASDGQGDSQTQKIRGAIISLVADFGKSFSSGWGHTALCLSGGGMLGFHHAGAVVALIKAGLLPNIFLGTSAGSAIAAWACSRTPEELISECNSAFFSSLFRPMAPDAYWGKLKNVLSRGYMCDKDAWYQAGLNVFQEMTFREAHDRTGRVLNISVVRAGEKSPNDERQSHILNYKTAPNVTLTSAVHASSAFPLFQSPFPLMERIPNGDLSQSPRFHSIKFRDGCLTGDVPISILSRSFHVGFSIVNQVNPHIFPFLNLQSGASAGRPSRQDLTKSEIGKMWFAVLRNLETAITETLRYIVRLGSAMDIWPSVRGMNASHIIEQSYKGDVTMMPRGLSWNHRMATQNIYSQPTVEWYLREGMLMVFPKVPLISARGLIERALDDLLFIIRNHHKPIRISSSTRGGSTSSSSSASLRGAVSQNLIRENSMSSSLCRQETENSVEGGSSTGDLLQENLFISKRRFKQPKSWIPRKPTFTSLRTSNGDVFNSRISLSNKTYFGSEPYSLERSSAEPAGCCLLQTGKENMDTPEGPVICSCQKHRSEVSRVLDNGIIKESVIETSGKKNSLSSPLLRVNLKSYFEEITSSENRKENRNLLTCSSEIMRSFLTESSECSLYTPTVDSAHCEFFTMPLGGVGPLSHLSLRERGSPFPLVEKKDEQQNNNNNNNHHQMVQNCTKKDQINERRSIEVESSSPQISSDKSSEHHDSGEIVTFGLRSENND